MNRPREFRVPFSLIRFYVDRKHNITEPIINSYSYFRIARTRRACTVIIKNYDNDSAPDRGPLIPVPSTSDRQQVVGPAISVTVSAAAVRSQFRSRSRSGLTSIQVLTIANICGLFIVFFYVFLLSLYPLIRLELETGEFFFAMGEKKFNVPKNSCLLNVPNKRTKYRMKFS